MVWGYVYRVNDQDRQALRDREKGYDELPTITVYLTPPTPDDDPTPITAFTFKATHECTTRCGPPSSYLDIVRRGAEERNLPDAYLEQLRQIQAVEQDSNGKDG
jgi:hypothetical protein